MHYCIEFIAAPFHSRVCCRLAQIDEIKDATSFLKMRTAEKRASLRASGIFQLPRPRGASSNAD